MGDKVWIVEFEVYDSYDSLNDVTVSIHRTEEGANKVAKELRKAKAIYALTGGMTEYYDDPDTVLGLVGDQNSEMARDLQQEAAKPNAIFIEAAMKVAQKHNDEGNIRIPVVRISAQDLKD